ncbi:hypothetical protein [Candidatus Rhabdochlamydia porcellionis]|jgi:hypothetical protein|uniref:Uncharacterized protein n=1 Tax=Candidatus Rhabdochlamydia porcellionis TaxID=225148 RepID=A0ABX8Z5M4_9BACT|nr:hypothetical protein [Candidatus Rhabdochlamydia porcellionis]QZA59332.1 hypothetical protein RHAB15C_0001218 [Candidatus Rhabdochlamydia porcellionis]
MERQKILILITSLVASYFSLEAASQQETLLTRLDAKGQDIHIQELAKKQEAERQKQYQVEKVEQQRIATQEERKSDRLKKQEIQEQIKLVRNLETDEDDFMVDSTVSEEEN